MSGTAQALMSITKRRRVRVTIRQPVNEAVTKNVSDGGRTLLMLC